jgi:predicted  nucleic acid-binding Zn-ribbon protein
MRSRSNASLQQMLAEMGIIRNGITSNNTDLTEFKRNTATVQQQMQSQISDLRDKLTDASTEIANMKKTKSHFEQEVHAEYQSLSEQLQFKTLELETLKKGYAHTHQLLQQQIIQLQTEVNELRMKGDDAHRQSHLANEQHVNKVSEVEMAAQYSSNELKRLRSDHDQAIANLAENMNRWNDTLRDLSKEFHNFQKVMNVNQQRIQSSLWDVQAGKSLGPQPPPTGGMSHSPPVGESARMESDMSKSPLPTRQAGSAAAAPLGSGSCANMAAGAGQPLRAQSPTAAAPRRMAEPRSAAPPMVPPYSAAPQASPQGQPQYTIMR